MRINSSKSIKTAKSVYEHFGSWKAARASARLSNGRYIVSSTAKVTKEDDNNRKVAEGSR